MNVLATKVIGLLDQEVAGLRTDLGKDSLLKIDRIRLKRMLKTRKQARRAAATITNSADLAKSLGAPGRVAVRQALQFSREMHGHVATDYAHRLIVMVARG